VRIRTVSRVTLVVAGLTVLTSCGPRATSADKTGNETVVLRLAGIDGDVYENWTYVGPQTFLGAIDEVSAGRLQVELTNGYGDGAADSESRLVEAIATGEVDGGWPATRSFAAAGIEGFDAVEAPMTISSYAAQKEVVSGRVAGMLLDRLEGSGVLGLGLTVGPLRRPFAAEAPLLSPEDWDGVRFHVFHSAVQSAAVVAIGGEPVDDGLGWQARVGSGGLRGGEGDIGGIAGGGPPAANLVTTNLVLWPKVFVLSINEERFESLTDEQQGWLREAAARAVEASLDTSFDESADARTLCEAGARFVDASAAQIAAMRARLTPVIDGLAVDDLDQQILTEIQRIAAEHPEPEALDVPSKCRHVPVAASAPLGSVPTRSLSYRTARIASRSPSLTSLPLGSPTTGASPAGGR
jgi:TRAP-type C4-dicarboxylate transport system substrate-binding protein